MTRQGGRPACANPGAKRSAWITHQSTWPGSLAAIPAAKQAAAAPSTQLAVAVYDRATHESAVGDRGTEPFYTASLAKVVLSIVLVPFLITFFVWLGRRLDAR